MVMLFASIAAHNKRRAGHVVTRPLNCGVMRHMGREPRIQHTDLRQALRRPFLLGIVAAILIIQAWFLPVFFVFILFSASDFPVVFNGVEVPIGEVRLQILVMSVLWFALAAYAGPGLRRGSAKARNVFFATFVVVEAIAVVMTLADHQGVSGLIVAAIYAGLSSVIVCVVVGWYLYMKPNVRAFFERESSGIANAA
jgi:hypothetical protein